MFGSQTRFFVVLAVCVACASVAFATQHRFSGEFTETREGHPHAYTTGRFYYLYDDANVSKSAIRFEYDLPPNKHINNLYYYPYSAMYSMCNTTCSAETITEVPDKWWYDSSVYVLNSTEQGSSLKWFMHKKVNKTNQISRILMSDSADNQPSAQSKIEKIEFNDGRMIVIKPNSLKYNDPNVPASSEKFVPDPALNCPKPTCSMFTDIVFVLDYSGSVSTSEWTQTANFVIGVMNSFTFGEQAAAAACIQFNAPSCYTRGETRSVRCDPSNPKSSTTSRYYTDFIYTGNGCSTPSAARTASILAGDGDTVSTNKADLINVMSVKRTPSGNTCQGFGLELAMKVFDKSPRNQGYAAKPNRVVIAVTDGYDHCPNRTQRAAKKLKEDYDAFFIGVGVGLSCPYDKNFIINLTSKIGTSDAYFDVANYSVIKDAVGMIFSPLCDEFHSGCGPDCEGFCGCGDCYCPSCDSTGNICYDYNCTARDGTSHGCQLTQQITCDTNTSCIKYDCDSSNNTAKCRMVETCAEVERLNSGSCRTVTCVDGKCIVDRRDNICNKFANDCEIWKCAGENETATDEETGCLLVRNITAECEQKNEGCFEYTCRQGQCYQVDTCALANTKCEEHECVYDNDTETYSCKDIAIENPYNQTKCDIYRCDDKLGWILDEDRSLDAAKCRALDDSPACKTFECDPDKGCVNTTDYVCLDHCLDMDQECVDNATLKSNLTYCITGGCVAEDNGTGHFDPHCNDEYVDCSTTDLANEIEAANSGYPSVCKTIMCQLGKCVPVTIYPTPVNNSCYYYLCEGNKTHGWDWVEYPTENVTNCHSDACSKYECDPNEGCIYAGDTCESLTDECFTLTCVNKSTNPVCVNTSELRNLTCKFDRCDFATGKKHEEIRNLDIVCPNSDKCVHMVCNDLGECEVVKNTPPGTDPCTNYTCNSTTGEWDPPVPKCDDGLFCTDDSCTIDGVCRHTTHDCYNDINMTDYPCFRAECKESASKCVRRIKNGVYIDVCGNCVREGEAETSSESSLEMTECTEAPDEPMIKESLAAASIAMIVLGCIIAGAAIAGSTILGTKTLLERARAANNQSAHSNPLFEENAAEMNNPTYAQEN